MSRRNWRVRIPQGRCWCVGCPRRAYNRWVFEAMGRSPETEGFVCDECLGRLKYAQCINPLYLGAINLAFEASKRNVTDEA